VTAFLDRIRYWLGKREPVSADRGWTAADDALWWEYQRQRGEQAVPEQPPYLADFGPNVPVEDLGAEPIGWEKAP